MQLLHVSCVGIMTEHTDISSYVICTECYRAGTLKTMHSCHSLQTQARRTAGNKLMLGPRPHGRRRCGGTAPVELSQPASLRDRQQQLAEHPWEPAAANAAFLPDLERPAKRSRTDASPDFKATAVIGDLGSSHRVHSNIVTERCAARYTQQCFDAHDWESAASAAGCIDRRHKPSVIGCSSTRVVA